MVHRRCLICSARSLRPYVTQMFFGRLLGYRCDRCGSRMLCTFPACTECRHNEWRIFGPSYEPPPVPRPAETLHYELADNLLEREKDRMLGTEYSILLMERGQLRPRSFVGQDALGVALSDKLGSIITPTIEQAYTVLASRFRHRNVRASDGRRLVREWIEAWDDGKIVDLGKAIGRDQAITRSA